MNGSSSLIILALYMFIIIIPIIALLIVFLIIFTSKSRKKRRFKEKYGCSQEYYEQLKKLKELYDFGILTAEEYEAKKKKFLGL